MHLKFGSAAGSRRGQAHPGGSNHKRPQEEVREPELAHSVQGRFLRACHDSESRATMRPHSAACARAVLTRHDSESRATMRPHSCGVCKGAILTRLSRLGESCHYASALCGVCKGAILTRLSRLGESCHYASALLWRVQGGGSYALVTTRRVVPLCVRTPVACARGRFLRACHDSESRATMRPHSCGVCKGAILTRLSRLGESCHYASCHVCWTDCPIGGILR